MKHIAGALCRALHEPALTAPSVSTHPVISQTRHRPRPQRSRCRRLVAAA